MKKWSSQDIRIMRRCLHLAQKGEGKVSPNPLVGAVVVKAGRVIGEGFHEKFGAPHAEANALRGIDAGGASLYVSLEPCSHSSLQKKTPPCVPLIVKSYVSRVVIAAKDANPKVRGIESLRAAGLRVEVGLLSGAAEKQDEAFFKFMRTGKPFVVLKMAQSANGKIGIRGKSRVWVSGQAFTAYVHLLRNRYDAILVGINTVLADNPRLTCRMKGGRNPARVILDSQLRIPLSARVLHNAKKEKVVIATSEKRDRKKEKGLKKLGATVLVCGKKQASLPILLAKLPQLGLISVLIEGGAKVASSALGKKVVDKAIVAVSQKLIRNKSAIASPFGLHLLRRLSKRKMGSDTVYEGYLRF